jgi:hypothetical protein
LRGRLGGLRGLGLLGLFLLAWLLVVAVGQAVVAAELVADVEGLAGLALETII